jgi:hypothetical protein
VNKNRPLSKVVERTLALVLLAALAAQLAYAVASDGMTVDEMVYIGCGYRHLTHSDFRMNPEQPPVAKMAAAMPLLLLPITEPDPPIGDDQIGWPDRFVHETNRERPILACARIPIALATLGLAALIWRWARGLYGAEAGLFALAVAAFHPSLLAHGHLATTDLLSALSFLLASWAFWRWSRSPTALAASAVGLALGLAVSTRFTAWLLPVVFALLWLTWIRPRRHQVSAWRQTGLLVIVAAGVAWLVVWAVYGFHYAPWPGESAARAIDPSLGVPGSVIAFLQRWRVLPEAYLEGLRFQVEHNRQGHWGYLLGENGSAWKHYYLVAYAVKNTPGFLLLTGLVLASLWRWRRRLAVGGAELHWLLPAAAVFVIASLARLQLGERYVLALYPYLILLAAGAAATVRTWRGGPAVLAAALALHVVPSLWTTPRGHLTYFNTLAGGPAGGHRVLADSNLDWGQDLPRLAAWMKRTGVTHIQLGYFGSDDPDRYGIAHEDLPTWGANRPQRPAARPFHGTIAVSANLLLGLFFPADQDPYASLKARPPDERVGVFFVYHLP